MDAGSRLLKIQAGLKPTAHKGLNKTRRTIYKVMSLCSNAPFHGATSQRCPCYLETRLHFSKRRLFLRRTLADERTLRLLRKNGARRKSRKAGCGCASPGKDDPRSGTGVLRTSHQPVSPFSTASLYSSRVGSISNTDQVFPPRSPIGSSCRSPLLDRHNCPN